MWLVEKPKAIEIQKVYATGVITLKNIVKTLILQK